MSEATEKIRKARDELLCGTPSAFHWPGIEGPFNWAVDWFDAIGRDRDDIALWIREEDGTEARYTYGELVTRSDRLGHWLTSHGIGRGDTVMLMLTNQVELWDAMLALMKVGAVILPTSSAVSGDDLVDRLDRARVRAVIANDSDAANLDQAAPDLLKIAAGDAPDGWISMRDAERSGAAPHSVVTEAGDPCLYYFTSGTTKVPKLVEHSQISYPVGHLSTMYYIGVRPGDIHLNISSPGWGKHAWSSFFSPWLAEATIFAYNYGRFNAASMLDQLREVGVATFCAPPTVWRMMILADLGDRPHALREIVGAGEPLNPEVIGKVKTAWGLTIRDGFGQTETTALVGNVPGEIVKPGSMGRPLPGVPVVVVDPETSEIASHGEICVGVEPRPLNLMTRYVGDPVLEAATIFDGLYHTGDLVSVDDDGYITYVGRNDDVFKASDYKVSPFELESVLMEHPAVAEAAVVPSPDPVRLAVPKAYIVLAPGWEQTRETALAILEHAKERLAPYLRVRRLEFTDLPKTISGKIRRVALRAREHMAPEDRPGEPGAEHRYEDFPELRSTDRSDR